MILREMMRLYMAVKNLGLREMAKEVGFSAPTLSRFLDGHEMDLKHTIKLLSWMTDSRKGKGD